MEQNATVVEAGIDWLTLRTRDPKRGGDLSAWFSQLLGGQALLGFKSSKWAWYGFQGMACGAVRWGVGERGVVAMISGADAHGQFKAAWSMAETVTRIDLCATVRVLPRDLSVSHNAYVMACQRYKAIDGSPKPSLWVGGEGGMTCYLGDRSSNYFGRIYDKYAESQDVGYTDCWRYEVECKAGVADQVAAMAAAAPVLTDWCANYVYGWWKERHVEPVYKVENGYKSATQTRPTQTAANSLGWLRRAVAPTVQSLIRQGHRLDVYDALGLEL